MVEVIMETIIDSLKLVPFLFVAFLIIELLEHKLSKKTKKIISNSKKVGPLVGSLLGLVPQCGFSVMATNLYVSRIISLGTLISVYLSCSDEMLIILLSERIEFNIIFKILLVKFIVGMISGFIIDLVLRKKVSKNNFDICDDEHCHCGKNNVIIASLKHTLNTLLFIFIASFILNILVSYVASDNLAKFFLKDSMFAPFLSSLIGLIPNCGASVMITELYLNNVLSLGSAIGGVLTGSGVAILVLFRVNKNFKENIKIVLLIYFIGVLSGMILNLFSFI